MRWQPRRSGLVTKPTKTSSATSRPNGRNANERTKRNCVSREKRRKRKQELEPKRSVSSASCNAKGRKKRGPRKESAKRRDVQSVSVYGRNSGCLKSKEKGNARRDMSGGDARNARDTGIGTVTGIVTETETATVIGIATVIVLAVMTEVCLHAIATQEETVPRPPKILLRLLHHHRPLTTNPWKKPLCRCS